jgi:hypothetical protein
MDSPQESSDNVTRGMPSQLPFQSSARSLQSGASSNNKHGTSTSNLHMSTSSVRFSDKPPDVDEEDKVEPKIPMSPPPVAKRSSALRKSGSSRTASQIRMDGSIQSNVTSSMQSAVSQNSILSTFTKGESNTVLTDADGMDASHNSASEDYDMDNVDDEASIRTSEIQPIVLWNIQLPMGLSKALQRPPSIARVARCIVRTAPCFWCSSNRIQGSSTDRAVLTRLNILAIFMAAFQFLGAVWVAWLLLIADEEDNVFAGFAVNFWNLNGAVFAIGLVGLVIIIACSWTLRIIRAVDLVGAIRYLWLVLWLIPFTVFFNISLLDYHRVTDVWVRHWWRTENLSWFRQQSCPEGTANEECYVPIGGGEEFESEDAWCLANHNSTDCTMIRDEAQDQMKRGLYIFYTSFAVWGFLVLGLLFLMVNSLERIISKPIVQKSREQNVPAWLTLPTLGCALVGAIYQYSPSSLLADASTGNGWISLVYLITAAVFLAAALLGWFLSIFSIRNSADKQYKSSAVLVFIALMAANTIMLAALFVGSIIFSADLGVALIDEESRGDVACDADLGTSCTGCDLDDPLLRCPEWTLEEVTRVLQTQLKQSATLAAIFIVYAIAVLRFGFVLRGHISKYQIDYV